MATIKDVSSESGFSIATVSRVVNNPDLVARSTRERVQRAISNLGYVPNSAARMLHKQTASYGGLVSSSFGTEYHSTIAEGVEVAFQETRLLCINVGSNMTAEGELEAYRLLTNFQCKAIVLHSDRLELEILKRLMHENPSLAVVGRCVDGFEKRCAYVDNFEVGRGAARHLLACGHRYVGQVLGHEEYSVTRVRSQGFTQVIEDAGFGTDPLPQFSANFSQVTAAERVESFLVAQPNVTALFCHNDQMAWGVMDYCKRAGVRIPQDLAIIAVDDLKLSQFMKPRLSTIALPLNQIGYTAGRLALAGALDNVKISGLQNLIGHKLIVRDTT
ncbi:LacI family DNA-binding transcriptional regulator [uncultured Tateyamaria sp.]|uniref:LacI family DNA-binding transcriptional regulator n=1 Tax=uncultured Tateyamaria sp. TaxID=455651 RepID=UPI002635F8DD|nr:LacI family DNA-binding transcriptional regulator [uncultured Tateyamaria sp.]